MSRISRIEVVRIICLTVALVSSMASLQAQPLTFTRPVPSADLTPAQQSAVDRLRSERTTRNISVVEVNLDALSTPGNKTLRLNKIGSTGLSQTTISGVNRIGAQDARTFSGRVEEDPAGFSTFVVIDGKVTGSYTAGSQIFKIRPLGGGKHAIIEIDPAAFPPDHGASFPQSPESIKTNSLKDTGDGKLTALILFTEGASARSGGDDEARAIIQDAVVKTNLSYANSSLGFSLLTTPVGLIKSKFKEGSGVSASLAALVAGKIEDFGPISELRNKNKADIVVLVTNDSDACGEALEIDANEASAFAVVTIECAADNFSLAHEIGHLQGARHDIANDATPGYNHGYCDSAKMKRTIMAYSCAAGLGRSAQWSRPKDWGKEGESNNAKKLKDTFNRISNYR